MLKNLVYFGSPEFSAEVLESVILSKQVNVVGVVTTPDKPTGRQQILTPSPIAVLAGRYDLPIYKPVKFDDANLSHLKLLKPDIFLVVSFGKIIPQSWLSAPSIGTFNIHFSLLPKYRGALCISEAIKNQDPETGVTLMVMDSLMDHGPIVSKTKVAIGIDDNLATLTTKLTQTSKEMLKQNLPEICAQNYSQTPQNESQATFTPSHKTLTHSSAYIQWKTIRLALTINNQELSTKVHALIRSLSPEPGAWTIIPNNNTPVILADAGIHPENSIELKLLKTSLVSEKLIIDTIQLPGKQPISWKQFLAGHSALPSHPL